MFQSGIRTSVRSRPGAFNTAPSRRANQVRFLVTFLLVFVSALQAATSPSYDYSVGDQAREDIITPYQLLVFDPEETADQKEKEAKRTPLIYRRNNAPQRTSIVALRQAMTDIKDSFLDKLESNYQKRVLGPKAIELNRYKRLLANFNNKHKSFPLTPELAASWALGLSDSAHFVTWTNHLLIAAAIPVRTDPTPDEFKKSGQWAKILDPGSPADTRALSLAQILETATTVHRTNILSLFKARQAFQQTFSKDDKVLARFLATYLEPNLELDEPLCRQWRVERTQSVWAADPYAPGTILVARGNVVTPKIKRALEELTSKLKLDFYNASPDRERSDSRMTRELVQLQSEVTQAQLDALNRKNLWLIGIAATMLAALLFLWRNTRAQHNRRNLVPAQVSGPRPQDPALEWTSINCPSCQTHIPVQLPALIDASAGHQPAPSDSEALRSRMMPHLLQWAKSKLMRLLVSQRDQLVENQSLAEQEIDELSDRLSQIHAPMEERLKAYENRINQLEEELRLKGEENKALIQARLDAARKKLALEKDATPHSWN